MLLKRSLLKSAGVLALCMSVFAFGFSAEMPVHAEGAGEIQQSVIFAGGSGTAEDPYRIETAEQLDRIREHLTDHYILMKDIDLSGYENWEPIGKFESRSDKPEDVEIPKEEVAFRGTFDGNGHMISGLHVNHPQRMAVGLFGCVLGTESNPGFLKNLTLKNVEISGTYLVGGAIGLQFMNFVVDGVALEGTNHLYAMQGIGGVVGTGFDWIRNCSATADITVNGDDGACAGLIAGGTTYSSIEKCNAQDGTITAEGNHCWGIGGVCGAPYAANEIRDCTAKNIKISIKGENNRLVGGIAGFAGTYDGKVAAVENCVVENAEITVSDTTKCVGGIVGGPKEITEGSEQMSAFAVKKCSVSGKIFGGSDKIGSIIGDGTNTEIVDCTGEIHAEKSEFKGQEFLRTIQGDYQPLFEGATFQPKYDHYWHDDTAAVVGQSQADDTVAYLKTSIGAKGYGKDAVPPNFYCGFTNDVQHIHFGEDGKTVVYKKTDGTTVSHEYEYVREAAAKGVFDGQDMMMEGHLYQAKDDRDDGFEYLLMFPDTPDTTYHLEFRYAETEEDVLALTSGKYGYWVGSAIKSSALSEENEATLQNVISLFVVENLAAMANEETNRQRSDLVGTWDCDFSAMSEYAEAQMYIVLGADGSGKTYADFSGTGNLSLTAEYTFFAYDPDKTDGKDAGTYISLNGQAETVTPGCYEIGTVNGKKALIFTSSEGTITYLYRETAAKSAKAQKITVKTVSKTYQAKTLKKQGKSFQIGAKAKTSLGYKVASYPEKAKKYITVSGKGKVTLKKNAKKGIYKIKVTAKATEDYKEAVKIITIRVK